LLEAEKLYQEQIKPLQFGEVDLFEGHTLKDAAAETVTKEWSKRVGAEFTEIAANLPLLRDSSIFVRIHESEMADAQFMITGPTGTPYARGCYKFDIHFPGSYPNSPPKVMLTTTGNGTVRFNPNLYEAGYVGLSLLGTWSGQSPTENWQPATSNFLQVVVSIQSLVMGIQHPYYNEPGYGGHGESVLGPDHSSEVISYTRNIQVQNIRWAIIDSIQNPPKGFEKVVRKHFYLQKDAILAEAQGWASTNVQITTELLGQLKAALGTLKDE